MSDVVAGEVVDDVPLDPDYPTTPEPEGHAELGHGFEPWVGLDDGRFTRDCKVCSVRVTLPRSDMSQREMANLPRRQYDWPTIKKCYVEGLKKTDGSGHTWPSLDEVAAINGVAGVRVRERSSQEGWRAERQKWQAQLENTRRQNRANALSAEGVNLDNDALTAAKTGLQLCQAALQDVAVRAQKARTAAGPGGGSGGVIDALEQQRLAAAVDMWHKIGLRSIGDPETHRLELTGANGAPIEISQELRRDDPNRIASVLAVLHGAGLGDLFGGRDDAERTLAGHGDEDGVRAAIAPGR